MGWASAAGMIGGALVSGIGAAGQQSYSARQAKQMYKHRYQWQMEDMRKAGINPLLAVAQGAGSPAVPGGQNIGEAVVRGGQAGFNAMMAKKLQEEQLRLMRAQGNQAIAAGDKSDKEARVIEATLPYSAANAENQANQLRLNAEQAAVTLENLQKEGALKDLSLRTGELDYKQKQALMPLMIQYQEYTNRAIKLGMSEKEADSQFWDTVGKEGKFAPWILQVLKLAFK